MDDNVTDCQPFFTYTVRLFSEFAYCAKAANVSAVKATS